MNLRQRYRRSGTLNWPYIIGFDSLRTYHLPYLYSDFLSKWTRGKCQAGKRVWFVLSMWNEDYEESCSIYVLLQEGCTLAEG